MVVECPMNRRKPHLPGRVLLLYAGTSWVYAVVVASQVALLIRADLSQTSLTHSSHHGCRRESM